MNNFLQFSAIALPKDSLIQDTRIGVMLGLDRSTIFRIEVCPIVTILFLCQCYAIQALYFKCIKSDVLCLFLHYTLLRASVGMKVLVEC